MNTTELKPHSVVASRAHATAMRTPTEEIVGFLQDRLGQHAVAYIADVNAKTVARWVAETQRPRPDHEVQLRVAFQIWKLIAEHDSDHTVRAWFAGLNPQLDDVSPLRALHDGENTTVMVAAKAFVTGG